MFGLLCSSIVILAGIQATVGAMLKPSEECKNYRTACRHGFKCIAIPDVPNANFKYRTPHCVKVVQSCYQLMDGYRKREISAENCNEDNDCNHGVDYLDGFRAKCCKVDDQTKRCVELPKYRPQPRFG